MQAWIGYGKRLYCPSLCFFALQCEEKKGPTSWGGERGVLRVEPGVVEVHMEPRAPGAEGLFSLSPGTWSRGRTGRGTRELRTDGQGREGEGGCGGRPEVAAVGRVAGERRGASGSRSGGVCVGGRETREGRPRERPSEREGREKKQREGQYGLFP